jgi:hypothetical protein
MTSTASLFSCAASDVTLGRVQDLVNQSLPESLTLEYKERFSPGLVKTVAAMANSYGGLIIVGVTEEHRADRLVGVRDTAVVQIVNACHERLEPPWQPEIIPVPLDSGATFVIILRVDPRLAPRPILLEGTAPVRLNGRNATADRGRLAQLFSESPWVSRLGGRAGLPPTVDRAQDGTPIPDFVVRSGLNVPVNEAAAWRPLSERGVDTLAVALNNSPIHAWLLAMLPQLGLHAFTPFRRHGLNRARQARLVWQADASGPVEHPIEAIVTAQLPDTFEAPATALAVTVDVVTRVRQFIGAMPGALDPPTWSLSLPDLYSLADGVVAGLTSHEVVQALADLAGIDPVIVPQPTYLHFVTGLPVTDVLNPYGLTPIADAGTSHGANLIADPALDLSDDRERSEQVDSWMQQIALDAGLTGMQGLLSEYHRRRREHDPSA